MYGRALRAAFKADRDRQMVELLWDIFWRYGTRSFHSFQAHLWWGWEYKIEPVRWSMHGRDEREVRRAAHLRASR